MKFEEFLADQVVLENGYRELRPPVSIVMPTYCRNQEGLLQDCIDSILAQTFGDFEFIIVDDGSVDGTEALVRRYAADDPRIVYVRHDQNSGLPAVRTDEGVLLARGRYVTFMFDDNVWVPDALETLHRAMEPEPVEVVHANTKMALKWGKSFLLGAWPLTRELIQHLNTIPNGAVLCRREFFDRCGLYDPHLILRRICDWDLWLRGVRLGARFRHVDKTMGVENGTASSFSIGHTVNLDYKSSYAYMACERQLAERTAALRPENIRSVDVFDPERVMPYLRDAGEWDEVDEAVYAPYFKTHPNYSYEPPVLHNRRYDRRLAGQGMNPEHGLFPVCRRILLISNRFTRLVREWRDALASKANATVLTCGEWQASAYPPSEIDLVILFDCTAGFLKSHLKKYTKAQIPLLYVVVNGMDSARGADDCCQELDLTRCEAILETMKMDLYFSLPGVPWSEEQRAGAEALMSISDQVLAIGASSETDGGIGCTDIGCTDMARRIDRIEATPNALVRPAGENGRVSRLGIYLGNSRGLCDEVIAELEGLCEQDRCSKDIRCEVYVAPNTTLTEEFRKYAACCRPVWTNETLPTLARELTHTCLLVPDSVLDGYSAFYRRIIEEDLVANGSSLLRLTEFRASLPEGPSAESLEKHVQSFRLACARQRTSVRSDARHLDLANLVLAALLKKSVGAQDGESDGRSTTVAVLLNSPLLSGSETVGLLLAKSLSRLGFDTRVLIPASHEYRGMDERDVNTWLRSREMEPAVKADYGMASHCFRLSAREALQRSRRLTQFLDTHDVKLVICAGFIPEPLIDPREGRLVYLGLMQPWMYLLEKMTFMRERAAGVFSDSRWAAEEWARWLAPPVQWIPTIVEDAHLAASPSKLPPAPIRIALGGTIQPRKRQIEALEAVQRLLCEGHDLEVNVYGYELAMVGDYVKRVKAAARRAPLEGRVHFHGLVDFQEIVRHNHLLLMTSIDESMPQTLLFALAGGLVQVACPSGGIAELVRDGETGFLADGFSVDQIARALRRALEQSKRWPEIVARGRAGLVQSYTEPIVVHRLLRLMLQGARIAQSPGRRLFEQANGNGPTNGPWRRRASKSRTGPRVAGHAGQTGNNLQVGPGLNTGRVRYRVVSREDNLRALRFSVGTFSTAPQGTLSVSVASPPSRHVLRRIDLDVGSMADNSSITAEFPPIRNSANREFTVVVSARISGGELALYEHWPGPPTRLRRLTSRVQKKCQRWLKASISRSHPAFLPLHGPSQ